MKEVDRSLVEHVASLAHLALSENEVAYYQTQLGKVLAHVKALDAMPDPLDAAWRGDVLGGATPEREDRVRNSLPPDEALSQAPRKVGTAFQVPRIIE